ncbi:YqjF family protein [Amycolatopsis pigmentata]|uniref:YqjF family protein n=1 Tax=Amycolatopsis pigmentata TaxID=450801 RepID=A0ABW5G2V7_9PSEU
MIPEAVTQLSPRPVRRATLLQNWNDVTFLHWPVDPARVTKFFPDGTWPDTADGVTYVGLVLFKMERVRLPGEPGLPYLRTFCETNVRLYSVDKSGRRGVVFRSLDAERLPPVLVGRFGARLPYSWSKMRLSRRRDNVAYTSQRRWFGARSASARALVSVRERLGDPSPLEHFLTARWGLHVRWRGRTVYLPNEHGEWPLHRAKLLALDENLVEAAGIARPAGPPVSVLYSPGVTVRFGFPAVEVAETFSGLTAKCLR